MTRQSRKKILGVIPARIGSTRLPRKILADIAGKPLIYYTWSRVKRAKLLDEVIVATDSEEILRAVEGFGGKAILTSKNCKSGSDRVAEAARKFPWAKIIVNIQGDEPIISPEAIDAAVQVLLSDASVLVATVATRITESAVNNLGDAKIVMDRRGNVLYFSRSKIPYPRFPFDNYLKHIGLYAFRRNFLFRFRTLFQTPLEKAEGLEQLRILEHGYKIRVAIGDFQSIGVDTEADLRRVRRIIKKKRLIFPPDF